MTLYEVAQFESWVTFGLTREEIRKPQNTFYNFIDNYYWVIQKLSWSTGHLLSSFGKHFLLSASVIPPISSKPVLLSNNAHT